MLSVSFPDMSWVGLGQGVSPTSIVLDADMLDAALGLTPADNVGGCEDTCNWLGDYHGAVLRSLFELTRLQRALFETMRLPADRTGLWLHPLVQLTEQLVAKGVGPDPVAADNLRIEQAYAEGIKRLVEGLTHPSQGPAADGASQPASRTFDRERCRWACRQPQGQLWLLGQLAALQALEWQYHSIGLTRLMAYKRLLRSLIQVIAGEPISDVARQPYRKPAPDGSLRESDEAYLATCEVRLLTLLEQDAFDIRRYALESPAARIGHCPWEVVPGSALFATRLRHYLRPAGVKPNGKTLYLASPMINRCEIFDLAEGKSVVEGMLALGYDLYLVDYGDPGPDQAGLGLEFFGKVVHDRYLDLIRQRHPGQPIEVMGYCMGGTLFLPYLARRAEEFALRGEPLDVHQVALMTAPVKFDDEDSGHKPMRDVVRAHYDTELMQVFYGGCNVPPQTIEAGMHAIQPGVAYTVAEGFFSRAAFPGAVTDAAPFLHWLHSGTRFPAKAHREWIGRVFMGNEIWKGEYCLPSSVPELDGKPVNMDMLNRADVAIFDYRGLRDPIAPVGSCLASERWGRIEKNQQLTKGGLNRTIEKNVGHIFVVSKILLAEYLSTVADFLADEPPRPRTRRRGSRRANDEA